MDEAIFARVGEFGCGFIVPGACAMGEGGRWGLQCRGDRWVESTRCVYYLVAAWVHYQITVYVLAEKDAHGS